MLTYQRAHEIFSYIPETGLFYYKISTNPRNKIGQLAGSPATGGYLTVMVNKRNYRLHRLAFLMMTGNFPKEQVDHINGNPSDNSWSNLRAVSHKENNWNRTSIGVCKHQNKFVANTGENGKSIHLGRFNTFEEAFEVAQKRKREYKKQFYRAIVL